MEVDDDVVVFQMSVTRKYKKWKPEYEGSERFGENVVDHMQFETLPTPDLAPEAASAIHLAGTRSLGKFVNCDVTCGDGGRR